MHLNHSNRRAAFATRIDSLAWSVVAGAAMITAFMFVLGVSGNDAGATQAQAKAGISAPAERTATEREWNAREDQKASANVGLPGIY